MMKKMPPKKMPTKGMHRMPGGHMMSDSKMESMHERAKEVAKRGMEKSEKKQEKKKGKRY